MKNVSREGPGVVSRVLAERGVPFEVVDLSAGEQLPEPKNYSAVLVFGGPDSANDETPKMASELEFVRKAVAAGVPFLGVCLGMQVLVKALGGWVLPNGVREVGWRDSVGKHYEISLTEEGITDALYAGLPWKFPVFQLHGETVRPTQDMALLATGKHCRHQAIKIGRNAYGLQYHFELTDELLRGWLEKDDWLRGHYRGHLEADWRALKKDYEANGRRMTENFLRLSKIIS